MSIRTCIHIKLDGVQCGSPAMRERVHCYFHHRLQKPIRLTFKMPSITDYEGRVFAINQIFQEVLHGRMDCDQAHALLHAVQVSLKLSMKLPSNQDFAPKIPGIKDLAGFHALNR